MLQHLSYFVHIAYHIPHILRSTLHTLSIQLFLVVHVSYIHLGMIFLLAFQKWWRNLSTTSELVVRIIRQLPSSPSQLEQLGLSIRCLPRPSRIICIAHSKCLLCQCLQRFRQLESVTLLFHLLTTARHSFMRFSIQLDPTSSFLELGQIQWLVFRCLQHLQ